MGNGWSVLWLKVHHLHMELSAAFLTLDKGALHGKGNSWHKQKYSGFLSFRPVLLPDCGICGQFVHTGESKFELLS